MRKFYLLLREVCPGCSGKYLVAISGTEQYKATTQNASGGNPAYAVFYRIHGQFETVSDLELAID